MFIARCRIVVLAVVAVAADFVADLLAVGCVSVALYGDGRSCCRFAQLPICFCGDGLNYAAAHIVDVLRFDLFGLR